MNGSTWTAPARALMDDPEETVELTYRLPTEAEALDYTLALAATSEKYAGARGAVTPGERAAAEAGEGAAAEPQMPVHDRIRMRVDQIRDATTAVRPLIVGLKVRGVAIPGDLAEYTAGDARFARLLEADADWLFRLTPGRDRSGD